MKFAKTEVEYLVCKRCQRMTKLLVNYHCPYCFIEWLITKFKLDTDQVLVAVSKGAKAISGESTQES